MCLISFVVPIYNAEKYLTDCLESLSVQVGEDIEFILVDDGSTDGSSQLCLQFVEKDARFHFYHKNNGGVSSARNYGVSLANGKWIGFVDADDYIDGNAVCEIRDKLDDSLDLVIFGIYRRKKSGIINKKYDGKISYCNESDLHSMIYTFLCHYGKASQFDDVLGYPFCKLYKRNIIICNEILFPEDMRIWEDTVFNTEYYAFVSNVLTIGKAYYYYRENNGSVTHTTEHLEPEYFIRLESKRKQIIDNLYATNESIAKDYSKTALQTFLAAAKNVKRKDGTYAACKWMKSEVKCDCFKGGLNARNSILSVKDIMKKYLLIFKMYMILAIVIK